MIPILRLLLAAVVPTASRVKPESPVAQITSGQRLANLDVGVVFDFIGALDTPNVIELEARRIRLDLCAPEDASTRVLVGTKGSGVST